MSTSDDYPPTYIPDLNKLPWRFEYYYKTKGYLIQVEPNRKEIIVFIPSKNLTFIADVAPSINIKKLQVGKTYLMEFAVYSAPISQKAKEIIIKKVEEPYLSDRSKYRRIYNVSKLRPLEQFFMSVPKIYRLELIKIIDYFYSKLIEQKFEQSVLNSFKAKTKYRWRHLLGF